MKIEDIDAEYDSLRHDLRVYLESGGRVAVVKAPPGSGKTHTLIEVLSALVVGGLHIAVAAQTNSQADDMCRRWAQDHTEVGVTRFASAGHSQPADFPSMAVWATDKKELPTSPGVTIATTAKWSLTDLGEPFDLLAIDEAWQMGWADLMQCASVSERFLMIGDPGQIPPVVPIDVRRWETSPRAPHVAAPEVVLAEPTLDTMRFVGSLPACRRLPHDAVDFVKPFYDFDFEAYAAVGARRLSVRGDYRDALGAGLPLALTMPAQHHGSAVEVDHELAAATARVVGDLVGGGAVIHLDGQRRDLVPQDIGITSSHRVMNSELGSAFGALAGQVRVDTPERWQGLERPVMVAVHPLSGVADPSAFDLETGRLCVMASRHQAALIVMTRDHVGDTLRNYVPSAEQAPGRPDTVGRGHDAHLKFWTKLEESGCVLPLR